MQSGVLLDVLEFGDELSHAGSLEELERSYLRGVGRFVDMPIRGLYVLDPVSRCPVRAAGENTSDFFLARYEAIGRAVDPLLSLVLKDRRAVYNLAVMSLPDWLATPVYREVAGLHGCLHVIESPLMSAGEVIGTLNFADIREESRAHTRIEVAHVLGRVVGQAVDVVRERVAARRLSRNVVAALDVSQTPVILNTSPEEPPWLNGVADALVAKLERGRELVYEAIARPVGREPVTRDLAVRFKNGKPGSLRIHSRSPSEDPDAVIAVLTLLGDRPPVDGTVWAALSVRERQVCELVVDGFTDREIAARLTLSTNTVSQYVKHIYAKTHTRSRVELTRLAIGAASASD